MTLIDWLIVGLYALFSVGIGIYSNRSIRSVSDYLVAGRNVRLSLNVATLTSTELAIITVMALAEVGYRQGFSAMMLGLCFFVGVTSVGATGFIIEGLRRHRIMTIPEFYGIRYHQGVRWLGGLVLSLAGILNMGVFLKISATFLAHISGSSASAVGWVMGLVLLVVLTYTLLGGRVSVVFTNYFQFLFIVIGAMVATGFALHAAGWTNMVNTVRDQYGAGGFNPFAHDDMGWPFVLLNTLVFFAVPTIWQPSAACGLSAANPTVARKTILWSGLTFMGRGTIPILWGIAALAYFKIHGADPAMKPVEAMPSFFAQVLPMGLIGLFVAGMLATDMSTYNGYLLAWSSILMQDVIAPLCGSGLSDRGRLLINRVLILLIGAFLLWWGLIYEPPASFFQYQQVTGTIYMSGALACILLGLYWQRANSAGAFAAIVIGTIFPVANVLMQDWIDRMPAWLHFLKNGWKAGLMAFVLAFVVMILTSLLTLRWVRPVVLAAAPNQPTPSPVPLPVAVPKELS
ncbi:MAG: sodium:solute symporter family protein [Candidatus Omnitrophica bacterium]|nr:sodium:solute symporter family protein [Candidatus Omnitrophota bacterium]